MKVDKRSMSAMLKGIIQAYMALYQEYLTNEVTGVTVLLGGDSARELAEKKQKQLKAWEGEIQEHQVKQHLEQRITIAKQWIAAHKQILRDALEKDMCIRWDQLHAGELFEGVVVPTQPNWEGYAVKMPTRGFLSDLLFSGSNEAKEKRIKEEYALAVKQYEQELASAKKVVLDIISEYEANTATGVAQYWQAALERSVYPGEIHPKPDVQFEVDCSQLDPDLLTQAYLSSIPG